MRKLVFKLCLLLTPVMAVYGFPALVLYLGGELATVDDVVKRQMNERELVLYGPAYTNQAMQLKIAATARRQPQVAALGTSRVMQIRAACFREDVTFYNAGGGVRQVGDFRPFLERLDREHTPRLLIVGLDQYFFNPAWDSGVPTAAAPPPSSWATINGQSSRVYQDFQQGKFSLAALAAPLFGRQQFLGLNAVVNKDGFRNDGSYFYGKQVAQPADPEHLDYEFRDTLARIAQGRRRFEYAAEVSDRSVDEVVAFLALCRQRQVHVVAFLPPYAHAVYVEMLSRGEQYGYLHQIESRLAPLFHRHGFSLFDFSDLAVLGADDDEAFDGFHGSEKAYLRMLLMMAEQDERLAATVKDAAYLRNRLASAPSPLVVFGHHER